MAFIFWFDIAALVLVFVLGIGLAFTLTAFGLKSRATRYFILFLTLQVLWAISSIGWRLSLGLGIGDPVHISAVSTFFLALSTPALLLFVTRYLKRRRLWADLAASGMVLLFLVITPFFPQRLVYVPHLLDNGLVTLTHSALGVSFELLALLYYVAALAVFWVERRNYKELYLPISISILVVGYIFGTLLNLSLLVFSVAEALGLALIAYGVFSQRLFNPLKQRTIELQQEIADRQKAETAWRRSQDTLFAALNVSHANLFTADMDTYEILYMNQYMREDYGDQVGQCCYVALQGRAEVCPECPHPKLLDANGKPNGTYLSEWRHPKTGKQYVHINQAIPWYDGRMAHMQIATDISERLAAEEELRRSEARYRSLFEEAPFALWEVDYSEVKGFIVELRAQGVRDFKTYFDENPELVKCCVELAKLLNVNQTVIDQLGVFSREEILKDAQVFYRDDFFTQFRDEFAALAEGKTRVDNEVHRIYKGEEVYRTVRLSIVSGYEDTWEKVIVSSIDITKTRQAEREVKLLGQIVKQMRDAVILTETNDDSTITYVNDAFTKIYGYEREEVIGKSSWILFAGDTEEKQELRAKRRQSIKKVGEFRSEYQDRKKDGTYFWVSSIQNVITLEGQIYDLGIVHDITERKQAEEQLQILGQITQQMKDAVILTDPEDRKVIFVNQAFCDIYGYEADEVIGKDSLILFAGHAEDIQKFQAARELALKENTEVRIEYRDRKKDGLEMWVSNTFSILYLGDERKRYDLGIIRDITAQKQTENEVLRLNRDLEKRVVERTSQLESFAYSVSHDLRAPLRAISGYASLLLEEIGVNLEEDQRQYLAAINQNAVRMDKLIYDLLTFSRVSRHELRQREIDTNALVAEVMRDLQYERQDRQIEFQIGDLPPCKADQGLLRQVFVNLLSNAVKFTNQREAARIEVGYLESEESFYIADNGVGFDMQYSAKLFNVFERLHSPDEYEGTGVGLAIVNQIIRRHGGNVWADAKVGEGAIFYFTLGEE